MERETARERQLAPLIEQQTQRAEHANKIKNLFRTTLDDLKENHNKNFHDMAVKSTISGYDEYLEELKKQEEDEKNNDTNNKEEKEKVRSALERMHAAQDATYDAKKDIGLMFQLIKEMKEKYNTEYNDEAVLKAIKVLDEFAPTWEDDSNDFVGEEFIEIPDEDASDKKEEVKPEGKDASSLLWMEKCYRGYCGISHCVAFLCHIDKGALGEVYNRLQKSASKIGLGFLFKGSKVSKSGQFLYSITLN